MKQPWVEWKPLEWKRDLAAANERIAELEEGWKADNKMLREGWNKDTDALRARLAETERELARANERIADRDRAADQIGEVLKYNQASLASAAARIKKLEKQREGMVLKHAELTHAHREEMRQANERIAELKRGYNRDEECASCGGSGKIVGYAGMDTIGYDVDVDVPCPDCASERGELEGGSDERQD